MMYIDSFRFPGVVAEEQFVNAGRARKWQICTEGVQKSTGIQGRECRRREQVGNTLRLHGAGIRNDIICRIQLI